MTRPDVAIAVLAKQPLAGRSKTRLSPPFSLEEAAQLAGAMLMDVVAAVAATTCARRVAVFEGDPNGWIPNGFDVIQQRGASHAERIGNAFADIGGPTLLIGMDTPQVSAKLIREAIDKLFAPGTDAVLGPATDGGWWAAGLRIPDAAAFHGVPMSRPDTVFHQRNRFTSLALRWTELPELTDIDDVSSADQVARTIPGSHFARLLASLELAAAR